MQLLISIGQGTLDSYFGTMAIVQAEGDITNLFNELTVFFIVAVVLFMLVEKMPPLLAGIVTGSSIGHITGVGSYGAGTATGMALSSAGMTKLAMGTAGSLVSAGAQAVARPIQAAMATTPDQQTEQEGSKLHA